MDDSLIDLIGSLGSASFAPRALDYLNAQFRADHLSLLVFDRDLVPHLAAAASRSGSGTALRAAKVYERGSFHRFDPGLQYLRRGWADSETVLFRLDPADLRDSRYRSGIYGRFGIVERVSLIRRVLGRWLLLNVYRDRASGKFDDAALSCLAASAALLVACAGKHVALAEAGTRLRPGTAASFDALLRSFSTRLTERERQVCAHALAGLTVAGIASTLGVKESTVSTLRRRAYAKLGVSSLSSLFALCLSSAFRTAPP
jgi:DNA-binding CsgD family transcriptional regulator